MTLTHDEVAQLVRAVSITAVWCGFLGAFANAALFKLVECCVHRLRVRRAKAPFVERAEAFERRAQRWSAAFARIAARNRREAIRRGDWVEES